MNLEKLEQIMQTEGSSTLGLRDINAFLRNDHFRVKKVKFEIGKAFKDLIDLEMKFPFNPLQPDDKRYNADVLYYSPVSCTSTVVMIKNKCNQVPELKEFWTTLSKGAIDFEKPNEVTEQEYQWFTAKGYRSLLHYHLKCYRSTLSGFGKYGRKFLANVKYDENHEVVEADLGYKLYELEVALAFKDLAKIREEMKKNNKTEVDINQAVKDRLSELKISNPYDIGTFRCLRFETDRDANLLNKNNLQLVNLSRYCGGSKTNVGQYINKLGSKMDTNFDFLEIDIIIDEPLGSTSPKDRMLLANQQKTVSFNSTSPIKTQIENFDELFREYRDNHDYFSEQVMLRSVYEYKPVDDSTLLLYYKTDFDENKKKLIDNEIATKYEELLTSIDDSLSETVLMASLSEDAPTNEEERKLIEAEYSPVNEDQEGFGIQEVEDEDMDKLKDFINKQ